MTFLNCDYNEGAHPQVLQRLVQTNAVQTAGYGEDDYCAQARALIRARCELPQAAVHFVVGGTQANAIVIAAALRPHQGVLCADTGHINVHETGAIEAAGHKVLALPGREGKITAAQVRAAMEGHLPGRQDIHTVQPGMVYLSFSTEVGTLYTANELHQLYAACRELGLLLYIDGARLGYGLAAPECDLTLPQLAASCDAFTIGGTKCGALFGEAIVVSAPALARDMGYIIKQRGGLLAKGRLLGVQFLALLEDGLYFDIAAQAVAQALRIRSALLAAGMQPQVDSPTNQQFFLLPREVLRALEGRWQLEKQGLAPDGRERVRICTSWATTPQTVDAFLADLAAARR